MDTELAKWVGVSQSNLRKAMLHRSVKMQKAASEFLRQHPKGYFVRDGGLFGFLPAASYKSYDLRKATVADLAKPVYLYGSTFEKGKQ